MESEQIGEQNGEQIGDEMNLEELNQLEASYSSLIDKYKYDLYNKIVAKDTQSATNSIDPIYTYHSLFLQSLAYWISLLDHVNIPEPELLYLPENLKDNFRNIVNETKNIINSKADYRVIAYNILNKKTTEPSLLFVR